MFQRMGELLVNYGELSPGQLQSILAEQSRDYRPFGRIAADLCDVEEAVIWRAWADQYARWCPRISLDREFRDPELISQIAAEDARRLRLLPLREQDGDLILITSEPHLADALKFVDMNLDRPAVLWLAEVDALDRAVARQYPD